MKQLRKVFAMILVLALLVSGCAAKPEKYAKTVAATYGDRVINLDEANFWLRVYESAYESAYSMYYYYYYGVSNIWGVESGNHGQTFAQTVKEAVMAEFLQANILMDHADKFSAELSEEDMKRIDDTVAKMQDDYDDDFAALGMTYTADQVKSFLINRSKAIRVWDAVKQSATDITLNEDKAKSFRVTYFTVDKTETASTAEAPTNQDLVDQLVAGLRSIPDPSLTIESLFELEGTEATYQYLSTTLSTSTIGNAAKDMKTGETKVVDKDGGWYVILMNDDDDQAAKTAQLEAQDDEAREEYFKGVYAEWVKDAKEFSVKRAFKKLKVGN